MEPSSEILIQNTRNGTWEPEFLSSTPVVLGKVAYKLQQGRLLLRV